MNCPCCDVELKGQSIKNVVTDECPKCKGVWFEDNELRQAKDLEDSDLNWMDFEIWKHKDQFKVRSRNLPCPQCNQTLVTLDYGDTNVEIDYCPSCKGSWLDIGEFNKIIEVLTNELLTKTFSEYIKTSISEAKEIVTGPETFLSEWKDFATVCRMMHYRVFVEHPQLLDTMISIQEANPIK